MSSSRKKMVIWILIALAIVVIAGVFLFWRVAFSRSCNPPLPRQTIQVGSSTFDAEMATTMIEQSCGLSGREGLGDNQGMLFVFGSGGTQNFWMKDMTFALDMVWISGDKVAGFAQDVPPPAPGAMLWQLKIYTSPPYVDKVLEVNAGTVAKDNIKVGDMVAGL